jgi:hypothetical protein
MTDDHQPQITALVADFNGLQQRVVEMFRQYPPERLSARPAPARWSATECISHLNLTTKLYVPLLHSEIRRAREQRLEGDGPYSMDWVGRFLRWFLEPPYRLRSRTVPGALPVGARSPAVVLEEFKALNAQLVSLLTEARGLALDSITVASPFNGRMKYNLYSVFHVIAAHERRHLWQAEQALGPR